MLVIVLSSKWKFPSKTDHPELQYLPYNSVPSGGFLLLMQRSLCHSGSCVTMIGTAGQHTASRGRETLAHIKMFRYSVPMEILHNLSSKPTRKQQKV